VAKVGAMAQAKTMARVISTMVNMVNCVIICTFVTMIT
jgi:hypothetical protein